MPLLFNLKQRSLHFRTIHEQNPKRILLDEKVSIGRLNLLENLNE